MGKNIQPIIVLGMHRSGTTMITKMLQQMGLYIGWDLHSTREANYFMKINEKILNICNGGWDNPTVIENLICIEPIRKKIEAMLNKDIESIHIVTYLNVINYIKMRSLKKIDFAWGWKDPRNTFTLPLWLDIFPEARIIHVFRNGIDVAQSLIRREKKRIDNILREIETSKQIRYEQKSQIKRKGLMLYLIKKVYSLMGKGNPLNKYERYSIYSCDTIEKAFNLWEIYTSKALEQIENIENKTLSIRYEDFLLDPVYNLNQLNEFCGLKCAEIRIQEIASGVKVDRRYAFKSEQKLLDFYLKKRDNQSMRNLGYNDMLEESA